MKEEQNHFIKNIEIKNFKCFENFSAEGFGRVNLIGGKNNVGKTAFMEAVYLSSSSNTISNLLFSLSYINIQRNKFASNEKEINIIDILKQYVNFSLKAKSEITYNFQNNDVTNTLFIELNSKKTIIDFRSQINFEKNKRITFKNSCGLRDNELIEIYTQVLFNDKEEKLNDYITQFDKSISIFKIIDSNPYIKVTSKYHLLTNYGDGLRSYISIIASLYAHKNTYLFLDEIENGIHYTNLDKLWEIILTISKEQNVQVFATTHSKECIESYARVAKKLDDEEIAFIELGRNKDDELKAMVYPYEWFIDEIEQNHEVRGW